MCTKVGTTAGGNRVKILHTIPYFLPSKAFGGPIWSTYHLCKEMVKRGHEITLLTTHVLTPDKNQKEFLENEVMDGITVKRFRIRARFMSYYITPRLIRDSISESADVIHAHGYRNFQTDAAALLSKVRKLPFVLQPRGMGIPEAAAERGNKLGDVIYKAYDICTMRFPLIVADRIIATTKFEKDLLEELNLKNKIEVIPHGVDTNTFKKDERLSSEFREKYNIDSDMILYTGRVDRGKNIKALLKAVSQLNENSNLTLVLVGEELASTQISSKSYERDLVEYSEKLGLNNVVFTGGLYNQDLISAYSAADIFVNPSISKAENFGLVNLEAAACSLPVVASPVGVAPELLKEHEELLFNTEEELTNILDKLLNDEILRKKIGGELRKKVGGDYTWSRTAERTERVYEEVLSQ